MVGIASNFSPMRPPFVFKMLRSWESGFIKEPVIFDIFRRTPCSFTSALLIEGDTEAETTVFTSFAWENLQFSGMVTLRSRFLSAIFERVFINAALVTSSDAGYDGRIQKTLWRLNPSWDYLLANLLLSLKMMRSPDETERRLPSRFHCKSYHICHG